MCKYVRRLETEDTLYLPRKQNSPLSRTVFSSMFPFLPCYNFMQCKGGTLRFTKLPTADAVPEVLLTRDFTVDFCFAKIAAATNLVSLRDEIAQ